MFTAAQQQASSATGWVIGLGKLFEENSDRYIANYLLSAVREALLPRSYGIFQRLKCSTMAVFVQLLDSLEYILTQKLS